MATLLGWLAIAAGVALLGWVAAELGWRRLLGGDAAVPAPERPALVFGGPYAVVRHPRSLAVLGLCAGVALLADRLAVAGVALLAAALAVAAARRDDRRRAARFGVAYARYQRAVPFLVPYWR